MRPMDDTIAALRDFSRFYTRRLGLLDRALLGSGYTLAEGRVLYELAHRDGLTAGLIGEELGIDAGYLSRILSGFGKKGFLERTPAPDDARRVVLSLTPAGREAFAPLDRASQAQAGAMMAALSPLDRATLARAMAELRSLLEPAAPDAAPIVLRPHRTGDLGWIAHRQGLLYAQEYGLDETFEALVAEILARFVRDHDPARERAWIAERGGMVLGSVFLMRDDAETGRLRLLYVEPAARGAGLGRLLVDACIEGARQAGYRRLVLWTNDVLAAARHIYEARGFRLEAEKPHHSFGRDLVGQDWALDLWPAG